MEIKQVIAEKADVINQALADYLPPKEDDQAAQLQQSMHYSVLAGGKRLRPILTLTAAELVGGKEEEVLPAACAVELIHNYSLIHDDLPCMDDDDLRRGQPANHKQFGTGMAVLAGDALLTLGFEIMADLDYLPAERVLQATQELAEAAGNEGMIGGQVADIEAENREISKEELNYIHQHKTGALLKASVRLGAILAGAEQEELAALTTYAEKLGFSFQIVDDVLDIEGDQEKLGKNVGSDQNQDKTTFPALYGLEESKKMAADLCREAKEALAIFGEESELLKELADYVVEREY